MSAPEPDSNVSEFHWCRHYLPLSIFVVSSVVSGLLSLLMLNALLGATKKYTRSQLKRIFYPTERKIVVLQYAVCLPMFELFVIWGSQLGISIDGNTASIVITWIVVNIVRILLVLSACCATTNYRLMIHVVQCYNLPLAVMFFTDRIINSVIGVEGIFIGILCVLALFEFFHVQDYFSVVANAQMPLTARDAPFSSFSLETSIDSVAREVREMVGPGAPIKAHGSDDGGEVPDRRYGYAERPDAMGRLLHSDKQKGAADFYLSASEDDEDDDGRESVTQLDERLPPDVRVALSEQKRTFLFTQFIQEVLRFDSHTDAEKIKKAVLRFKANLEKVRSPPEANSGGGGASGSGF